MSRYLAFKFQLQLRPSHQAQLRRYVGQGRWIWNQALKQQGGRRNSGEKYAGYAQMCKWLTAWRSAPETAWLAEGPVHTQQQVLRRLDASFKRFFSAIKDKKKRVGRPRHKAYGREPGLRFPDAKQIELDLANSRIRLPKLGWLRVRASRALQGTLRNASITREAGRWFVSLQTEVAMAVPALGIAPTLGIDLGVTLFAATSEGAQVEPLAALTRERRRLKHLQRCVSRRKKGSKNRRKAVAKLGKLHKRIRNQRVDWLHKITTDLADSHPVIAIEDLRVAAMTASARGTAAKPGRNVKAKAGLNRSILDAAWGEFRRQLQYKLAARGGELVTVNPAYTSQTCRICSHRAAENRKSQSAFQCVACGHAENADVHAAKNILAAGHAVWAQRNLQLAACGESVSPAPERRHDSMKQEPTEGPHSRECACRLSRNPGPLAREDVNEFDPPR